MTFNVKDGRYGQQSKRVGGKVRSIYLGKTGNAPRVQRPTKLDRVAGTDIDRINKKITDLYNYGYGDRKIAVILQKEDGIENPAGSIGGAGTAISPGIISTQRKRLGVANRVCEKKEPKPDWEAIAKERQSSIDELNQMLASTMDERDRYIHRLEECRAENYARKFPTL